MKQAFRQPGFGLLFTGLATSMIGDSLMLIVLAIWVKELTGSSGAAGLVFFFMVLPTLASPLAGMLVDRARRRTVLIWGNLASAAILTPLLLVHGRNDVWLIYVVAVLYGVSWIVLPGALNGLLKEMLPERLLVDANASLSTTKESLRLFGPLLGAGLYTLAGGGAVAMLDAASFVVAAIVIVALKVREDLPQREESHWRAEVTAGVRHIWSDAVLRQTLAAVAITLLVVGFLESAIFAAVQAFDKPPSFVGVVVSVQGVGAVVGGLSSAKVIRGVGEVKAIVGSLLLLAVGLAVDASAPALWLFFIGVVCFGAALPVFIVALNTLLQVRTPQRLMGRVSGAADVLLGTPQSGSIALGALLVTVISFRSIFWICAAVITISALFLVVTLRGVTLAVPDDDVVDAAADADPLTGVPMAEPDALAGGVTPGIRRAALPVDGDRG